MKNGYNIATDYNMLAYKVKVVHFGDDMWHLLPIIHIRNFYSRVYNSCGDDSGTVLPDDGYFCDTVTPDNTDFIKQQH